MWAVYFFIQIKIENVRWPHKANKNTNIGFISFLQIQIENVRRPHSAA